MKPKYFIFVCLFLTVFGLISCGGGDDGGGGGSTEIKPPEEIKREDPPNENSSPKILSIETDGGNFTDTNCGGAFAMCVRPNQKVKLGECFRVTINATDPDGDDLYYRFKLMNMDFTGGIRYSEGLTLSNELSGRRNSVEICAYSDSPSSTLDMWVQVGDNEKIFPYVQVAVPFYIYREDICTVTTNCSSKKCYNGDVWCYNDCGERYYRDEMCDNGCTDGVCNIEGVDITNVSYVDDDTATGDKLYYIDVPMGYTRVQFSLAVPVYDESLPDAFDIGVNLPSTGDYPTSASSADMSDLRETPGALFEFTSSSSPAFEIGRYYILVEKRNSGGPFRIRTWRRSF